MGKIIFLIVLVAPSFCLPFSSYGMGSKPQRPAPTRQIHRDKNPVQSPAPKPSPIVKPIPTPKQTPGDGRRVVGALYRERYAMLTAGTKLVDNHGNGFDRLYGVRNFRAVLNGVFYRGGANNYFNKHHRRSNMNPLPTEGLTNLCEEGFGHAVYLYSTNFSSAPKSVHCRIFQGNDNTLEYLQISVLDARNQGLDQLLGLVYQHIRNPRLGPIYDHCWNGWHASGFISAITLRQFCGFSGEQAVEYWNANTDGDHGRAFEGIRARIRSFIPNRNLALTPAERSALCPAPNLGFLNWPT
jgi:hypothetical protein